VVPPDDSGALAQAIVRLAADPDELRRLGEAAQARALQEFSATTMVDRLMRQYEEVIG
jgi:glycosyltransferase involved in cell wall biosynthesis